MSSNVTTIDYRGHRPECAVTAQRVSLLSEIVHVQEADDEAFLHQVEAGGKAPDGTAAYRRLRALIGAAVEYYDGGDQEIEGCTCGSVQIVNAAEGRP